MTTTTLALQGPDDGSEYLLELLLLHSIDAVRGGGAYAWATVRGIDLLFGDSVFKEFLTAASFQLIVGVDAVTTPEALERLAQAEGQYPGLSVRAFMSEKGEGLFHPKFAWFVRPVSGSLLVGSGNLTGGGLWDNREALTVTEYDDSDVAQIESQWGAWRTVVSDRLYPVSDNLVIERASKNKQWNGKRRAAAIRPAPVPEEAIEADSRAVLIAEIPKAGDRWEQANFHKVHFVSFFGATPGEAQKRIRIRAVDALGQLSQSEPARPAVARKSKNWSFELAAAKGEDYPSEGRPIGVFLRLRKRTFVYSVLMPGDANYDETLSYLKAQVPSTEQMRQVQRQVEDVDSLNAVKALVEVSDDAFEDDYPE